MPKGCPTGLPGWNFKQKTQIENYMRKQNPHNVVRYIYKLWYDAWIIKDFPNGFLGLNFIQKHYIGIYLYKEYQIHIVRYIFKAWKDVCIPKGFPHVLHNFSFNRPCHDPG